MAPRDDDPEGIPAVRERFQAGRPRRPAAADPASIETRQGAAKARPCRTR